MQGIILQGIGGFYYALDESGAVHQVRAQRKLRRDRKPMVGDRVEVGCNTVLNPGTVIGRDSNIYPVSCVRGVVPANCICKTGGVIVPKKS